MSAENLLEKVEKLSPLTIEAADLASIRTSGARDVSLSAARITAAAQEPEHADAVDAALHWAQQQLGKSGNRKLAAMRAVDRLAVEFARRAAALVAGRVSVEIDARLAYQVGPTIDRAQTTMQQLAEVAWDRTERSSRSLRRGRASKQPAQLERRGIHCLMTLAFGMHQAAACADAGVAVLSPAVGRITDWHAKQAKVEGFAPAEDPGVLACMRMYHYLKRHGYRTEFVPSTFRSADQALALAGSDGSRCHPRSSTSCGCASASSSASSAQNARMSTRWIGLK